MLRSSRRIAALIALPLALGLALGWASRWQAGLVLAVTTAAVVAIRQRKGTFRSAWILFACATGVHLVIVADAGRAMARPDVALALVIVDVIVAVGCLVTALIISGRLDSAERARFWAVGVLCMFLWALISFFTLLFGPHIFPHGRVGPL